MTMIHQFTLEPYKGMKTRYNCPNCNKKEFVRYVDSVTGEYLSDYSGRCNRIDNCGYHYTPKQFFADNPELSKNDDWKKSEAYKKRLFTPLVSKPAPAVSYIPFDAFKKSLNNYESNHFIKYLLALFGEETTKQLIERYYIGASGWQFYQKEYPDYRSPKGATIFWQIDNKGKVRTGKIMLYSPDTGKRIKEPFNHIQWEHKALRLENFNLDQCIFGEHLLKSDYVKPVAIVESEKTAIIASVYLPQFIWLAVGSLANLKLDKCEILKGRNVVLYPDLNAFEKWSMKAKEFSSIAHFTVSDLLERSASEAERKSGLDLADYLIKFDVKDFQEAPAPVTEVTQVTQEKQSFFRHSKETSDDKPAPAVKHRAYEDPFFTPSVSNQSWEKDIAELETYFSNIILPENPLKLNDFETIGNVSVFVSSHIETLRANDGKRAFLPFIDRLHTLKNYFITKQI